MSLFGLFYFSQPIALLDGGYRRRLGEALQITMANRSSSWTTRA